MSMKYRFILFLLLTIISIPSKTQPGYIFTAEMVLNYNFPDSLKFGVIDSQNKIIIPFVYNHIAVYNDSLYAVRKGAKWGLLNKRTGEKKAPFIYDYIEATPSDRDYRMYKSYRIDSLGFFNVIKDSLYTIIDNKGKEIFTPKKKPIYRTTNPSIFLVPIDGIYYLTDRNERKLLPESYSCDISRLDKKRFLIKIVNAENKSSAYDVIKESFATSEFYDDIDTYHVEKYGLFRVKENENNFYIDTLGNRITPLGLHIINYDPDSNVFFGYKRINDTEDKSVCLINWSQNIQTPFYDDIDGIDFHNYRLFRVSKKGKMALINSEGKVLTPFRYSNIQYFDKKTSMTIATYGKYNTPAYYEVLIDTLGNEYPYNKETYKPYSNADHWRELNQGFIWIDSGDWRKSALVNKNDEVLTDYIYQRQNHRWCVYRNKIIYYREYNYGFMDFSGKELTPPIYSYISDIGSGFRVNLKEGLYQCLDNDLNILIPENKSIVVKQEGDLFWVVYYHLGTSKPQTLKGILKLGGEVLIPSIYESIFKGIGDEYIVLKNINSDSNSE